MLSDDFIDSICDFGEDDWLQFIDIGHVLIDTEGTNRDLVRRGGAAAVELIYRGIMRPGFLGEYGFEPWNLSDDEAISKIQDEIEQLAQTRDFFHPGDICWFQTVNFKG